MQAMTGRRSRSNDAPFILRPDNRRRPGNHLTQNILQQHRNDEELSKLLGNVTIASGGVLPNIHSSLLNAKKSKKKSGGGGNDMDD